MPRDTMISVVNLKRCLGMPDDAKTEGLFIITNFNKLNIAFHVDAVLGIHRVSWEAIIKPDATINTEQNSASTGVIKMDDKLIIILDFEKIVTDISPETGLKMSDMDDMGQRERCESPILIAEDSPLLSRLITDCLKKAGYTNLIVTMNGQEAWDKLQEFEKAGNVREKVHCIITDIEMPLMDGHRLTKLVKTNDNMKKIPLIIFSSLVYQQIPVGHVEAGLRTYDIYSPWPEEMNRQITGRIATYNFAPTPLSKEHLLKENISNDKIVVTGNTVIDALYWVVNKIKHDIVLEKELKGILAKAGYDTERLTR